jgi:ATP-dependent DNA ligase
VSVVGATRSPIRSGSASSSGVLSPQGTGSDVIKHVCRMGLEGIVSKRTDASYRSGASKTWVKTKNPASEAVRREREAEWR